MRPKTSATKIQVNKTSKTKNKKQISRKKSTKRHKSEFFKFDEPLPNPRNYSTDTNDFNLTAKQQQDSWLRTNTIDRLNVELKELARQDPTNRLDILDPVENSNQCQYSWKDIELLEKITRRMKDSTVNCKDKKCFFHGIRF
jgi:hypothetical protein